MDSVINWLAKPFELNFLQNALLEMLLISLLAGVVGSFVVLRGMAFIVDGLSHAILPGIAVAFLLNGSIFWGALVAALLVSGSVALTGRNQLVGEDSAVGITFTGAFAVGVIIIARISTKGRNLNDILFGQLFAVQASDLLQTLLVSALVVLAILALGKELLFASFDSGMARASGYKTLWLDLVIHVAVALTVVVALPAVGNILVLAFLITPAATARLFTDRFYRMVGLAVLIAFLTGLSGIYLSYYLNIAGGGATVVVVGTILFLLALIFSPRYGALNWLINRWWVQRKFQVDWQAPATRE
ncbi:MAG TPA: metal ABC transporter permease [Chloroflexia bacterium]|nr:metal ABC transporter permease [Chloroflexia bacterium]